MARSRILVLTSTLPGRVDDGTPAFVADLALEMGNDYDVRILAPAVPGAARRERLSEHVEVHRFRFFPSKWEDVADGAILENVRRRRSRLLQIPFLLAGLAFAITSSTKDFRPDAVHAHWIIPQGAVASVTTRGVPIVVTTLGGDLYALNSRLFARIKRRVLRGAAAVTVMNEDMRGIAIALGARSETTHVMPMGARLSMHGPRPARAEGAVALLAVGRLVEKKGFDVLLRALGEVSFPYRLQIVGDGPERARLEALAAGLPVEFLGQLGRADLSDVYARSDIAVFPSRRASTGDQDGLPVAMLEAMGAGCAIVASDLPGLAEAIQSGRSGIIVRHSSENDLRDAITALATDEEHREALGKAARERSRNYSVEAVGAGYVDLFRSILRR